MAFHTFTQKTSDVTLFLLALHYVIIRVFIRQLYFTNYNPLIPIRCLFFASVSFPLIGYSHLKVKVTVCQLYKEGLMEICVAMKTICGIRDKTFRTMCKFTVLLGSGDADSATNNTNAVKITHLYF